MVFKLYRFPLAGGSNVTEAEIRYLYMVCERCTLLLLNCRLEDNRVQSGPTRCKQIGQNWIILSVILNPSLREG